MSKRIILFLIVFWMIFAVMPMDTGITEGEQCSARVVSKGLTVHEPIHIYGNDDFTEENGVVNGSGTESDPYIIEGWDIDASQGSNAGIEIRNTNVYFIIRNC
ncbi:MAG: right-handed parallel beta-helix repeat-containing protein, partial [Candidatus Thermoplasmatota archaeon]|nr:right-handed parallel beta-helix repeat-containing protein [Candidatus Thermoplasmatota archaeon]